MTMNYWRIYFVIITLLKIFSNDIDAIINGRIPKEFDYGYMVSLWYFGFEYICGGIILDEMHILTSAHCVEKNRPPGTYTIHAGVKNLNTRSAVKIKVEKIHVPDGYVPSDSVKMAENCPLAHAQSDIAVLTLRERLNLGSSVQKVKLPKLADSCQYYGICHIAGWGRTALESSDPSSTLLYAMFLILPFEEYAMRVMHHRSNELCAMDPLEVATPTKGDSGDPLVCNGVVYGVLSATCSDPKYPTIFASVVQHLDFIHSAMKN